MHFEHAKDICKKLESRTTDDKRVDWKKDDDKDKK